MSKQKNKKNQPAEHGKRDSGADAIPLSERKVTEGKTENEGGGDTTERTPEKVPSRGAIKRLEQLKATLAKSSLTDRLIATFTGLLAFVAIAQGYLLYLQIETMRTDLRPWVKIMGVTGNATIQPGDGTMGFAQMINSGKQPAKNVSLKMAAVKLRSDQNPDFSYDIPYMPLVAGILYPNAPTEFGKGLPFGIVKQTGTPEFEPITEDDMREYLAGETFYVVYGEITYTDFFRTKHWTHFCTWMAKGSEGHSLFNARKCTEYNDADDN